MSCHALFFRLCLLLPVEGKLVCQGRLPRCGICELRYFPISNTFFANSLLSQMAALSALALGLLACVGHTGTADINHITMYYILFELLCLFG